MRLIGGTAFVAAVLLGALGCSGPKDVSKANFERVIQRHYSTLRPCFTIRIPTGGMLSRRSQKSPYQILESDPDELKALLGEAVRVGLLTKQASTMEVATGFRSSEELPAITYEPTVAGKQAIKTSKIGTSRLTLCYGSYVIEDITSFTEPADFMGQRVTEVRFTYKVTNVDRWASESPLFQREFDGLAEALDGKVYAGKAALLLTSEGWEF